MKDRNFDAELYGAGITLACGYLEGGTQRFVEVAQAIGRDVGRPPVELFRYLRSWYEGARYACLDNGIDVSNCDSEDDIIDALVTIDEWGETRIPVGTTDVLPQNPNPSEAELRDLMGRALSAPTPQAIMHFTRFASRMKAYGPYNIYMIYAQRPGAGMVASKQRWRTMGRSVRPGAIPILILQPLGPITQVYEELDTAPQPPRDPETDAFAATGQFDSFRLSRLIDALAKPTSRHLVVRTRTVDFGRNLAGWITGGCEDAPLVKRVDSTPVWEVSINGKFSPAEQFTTLLHELGHLFCGHLGPFIENNLKAEEYGWPDRRDIPLATKEIEAELVAWWLAEREGIITGSPIYLRSYFDGAKAGIEQVDLDRITRAVARVRSYLGDKG